MANITTDILVVGGSLVCKALVVASGGISGNIEMMKEEGVLHTKFEEAYRDGGQVMITFPDSCQDGGGKKTGIVISADPQVSNPGVRIGTQIR